MSSIYNSTGEGYCYQSSPPGFLLSMLHRQDSQLIAGRVHSINPSTGEEEKSNLEKY